jgi:hypothetical protein
MTKGKDSTSKRYKTKQYISFNIMIKLVLYYLIVISGKGRIVLGNVRVMIVLNTCGLRSDGSVH